MCDPLTIAGVAAATGGAYLNNRAQNKALAAQQKVNNETEAMARAAREAERVRQKAITDRSLADVRDTAAAKTPQDRAEEAVSIATAPTNPIRTAGDQYAPLPTVKTVSGQQIGDGRKIADGARRTRSIVDALALLSAQGTGSGRRRDELVDLGTRLSSDASESAASADTGLFEARIPTPRVSQPNSIFGDLLLAGGQLGAAYGANQFGLGGKKFFPNADLIGQKGAFAP